MVELERQNYKKNKAFYKQIENELRKKIDKSIPIEQVGSTAIPNMYGKNIMDILIGASDNIEFDYLSNILEEYGYIASKKSSDGIYQFFASTSEESGSGDIHIHLVIKDTERYNEFIILRNYLLSNKEEAKKYSDYKRNLIKSGILDRREYKRIKSEYVSALLNRAKEAYRQ